MRVLVVGPDWEDGSEVGCVNGLRAMGHTAELFDPRKYIGVPRPLQRYPLAYAAAEFVLRGTVREPFYFAQKPLLARARALKADLVLVVQLLWVLPETIAELRGLGITCAGWFPDAFTSFGRGTFLLAPWNGLFFQDRFMVARLRQSLSADYIHHLPECMDRVFHRPIALSDDDLRTYGADVATFGNYYPYRAKLIEPLLGRQPRREAVGGQAAALAAPQGPRLLGRQGGPGRRQVQGDAGGQDRAQHQPLRRHRGCQQADVRAGRHRRVSADRQPARARGVL